MDSRRLFSLTLAVCTGTRTSQENECAPRVTVEEGYCSCGRFVLGGKLVCYLSSWLEAR